MGSHAFFVRSDLLHEEVDDFGDFLALGLGCSPLYKQSLMGIILGGIRVPFKEGGTSQASG